MGAGGCAAALEISWSESTCGKRRKPFHGRYDLTPRLLVGEREHRLYPLDPQKIDYIESDGNYVSFRSGNTAYISRDTIKRLAAELAQLGFVRIGRSLLVNVRAVVYAQTIGRGRFAFTLGSGACLHSSAAYRHAILEALPLANRRSH
jgi:DNA-binding LytR/AlgR family response regulator